MLIAYPEGLTARTYRFEEDGWEGGRLKLKTFKEAAEFELSAQPYQLKREKLIRGPFQLIEGGEVILSAEKPSAFRDRFEFDLEGEKFLLKPTSWSRRRFVVLAGEEEVGVIRQTGWLTRKSTIDLPDTWALPVRVFIFWLVVLIWARDDANAS